MMRWPFSKKRTVGSIGDATSTTSSDEAEEVRLVLFESTEEGPDEAPPPSLQPRTEKKSANRISAGWGLLGIVCLGLFTFAIYSFFGFVREESKERRAQEEVKRLREVATQAPPRPVAPPRVATEWMPFTAPPKGKEPKEFPKYPHGWNYQTGYNSTRDQQREDLVGAVLQGGRYSFPDGKVRIRSKDDQLLTGWIRFVPIE